MSEESKTQGMSRRAALGACAALAGGAALGVLGGCANRKGLDGTAPGPYPMAEAENIIHTSCLQCNTQCTLKVKVQDGLVVKIDGNPYSPMTVHPNLPYDTPPAEAVAVDGAICPKGQAGVQTLYDPYRVRKVLKRTGPRGANRWKSIPFDQAIKEICDGGKLFADIGEDREIAGFNSVVALRDAALAKQLAADVGAIRKGEMTVDEFKAKNAAHLGKLLDSDHPDLGPKNNQFVLQGGRISPDRDVITKRFTFGTLGSVNWFGHTTICEQAHHVAFMYSLAQWQEKDDKFSWAKGPNHMKPDYTQSEFVIFWGTGFNEANFGPTPMSPRVSQAITDGKLKIAVIDPRLSKSAAKGWWLPVHPGGNLALALAMIQWIIAGKRYDEAFLRNANKAAAKAGGEKSWSNATWLVNTATGKFLRAADAGVGTANQFVALVNGVPVAVDPSDEKKSVVGDLDVAGSVKGVEVASSFRMLKDAAAAKSFEEYARIAGLEPGEIEKLAREFTAHGKKAAIDFYRGPIKTTYGYYSAQAIILLNFLIGNVDHVGGFMKGGGAWDGSGGKPDQPFPVGKMHPGALAHFGVKLTREASGPYETSTLFKRDGYPAKRPWFPFTDDVYQEIIPAANAGYPYPIKILWLHYGTPALAAPAGHLQIKMLKDTAKFPLFIATDVVIGETSMYADYIFPDLSYLERWSNPLGTSPVVLSQISKFRQPAAAPVPEVVTVDGEEMPISIESVMISVAKRLGLSGFGKDAFGPGQGLNRPEDFHLKMVANLAAGNKAGDEAPEADDAELELLRKARRHLPKAVFDEQKWQAAVGPLWRRVVYLLNRGGRFEKASGAYDEGFAKHAYGNQLNIYVEPVAGGKHSVQGKRLSGVPVYEEMESFDGKPVAFPAEYEFEMITYKDIHGGQSRTSGNYAGHLAIMPENFVFLNELDASRLKLTDGDVVRLESPGFGGSFEIGSGQAPARVEGKLRVTQGLRPGVVSVSWHYGHWAYGARDVEIDGQRIPGEPVRGKGLVTNAASAVDGYLKDVCLTDPIAGDSAFTGSRVKLVKVASSKGPRAPLAGWVPAGWASR
ncbi:Molydopterin dinucleotide binding domain-containing protein [Humidesulfovibrio mexicanus]|uniref:Molydopterin dinucleotide binding domain-containing protein n=1 Tax=Humidesulfovibrio mexicanus TaxID=147047 RepID=A0A239CIC0_9BACT|nr:molybdopterin-dependent oxidoreductase [Humidesulfovibrio mexicanus]SNS19662.1 Molydopterin dinucleotide binding domain-containing protein [Humidesulfovibrio mexicanus]